MPLLSDMQPDAPSPPKAASYLFVGPKAFWQKGLRDDRDDCPRSLRTERASPAQHPMPAISLTLPKQEAAFRSTVLFPFFFGLLAEGENKTVECHLLRIDENDHFTRLLRTCTPTTILRSLPIGWGCTRAAFGGSCILPLAKSSRFSH